MMLMNHKINAVSEAAPRLRSQGCDVLQLSRSEIGSQDVGQDSYAYMIMFA